MFNLKWLLTADGKQTIVVKGGGSQGNSGKYLSICSFNQCDMISLII